MKGANIVGVLADTLNPNTTNQAFQQLSQLSSSNGFAVQLLVISDDSNLDISIRQSSLIYLKNFIKDHCQRGKFIPQEDLVTLKSSLLEALIRNVTNHKLTPTFRQLIYILSEKYYPKAWPEIVDEAVIRLQSGSSLGQLLGTVQALKAIFSVFGGSVVKQIELSNLCNKTIIPLLGLASKLFQNFNPDTATILVSIFKLFSTAINFHLSQIIEMNIHSFMIFIKKLLDIRSNLGDSSNDNLYTLKKICLRILFRIYQRHANMRLTSSKQFAINFQTKYTRSFVQTLVLQVLGNGEGDKRAQYRHLELTKLSLSCLAYINRENSEAASILIQNRDSMVKLCLQNFKISFGRNYQNFADFKLYVQQNRIHLKQFLFSLLRCDALPDIQDDSVTSMLSLFLECLSKGDDQLKQLCLYIFSQMSAQVQYLKNSLDDKMIVLIIEFVKPLLKESNHIMLRARACQLLASYNYLDLPQEHLSEIAQDVYNCMLVNNSQKGTYLKIFACNAFNSLLKYDSIVEFIKPYLQQILKIYTSLMENDATIIKNFEDLLNLLEEEIAPFANDLVRLLIGLFDNYSKQEKSQQQEGYGTLGKQERDGEDDQEDNFEQEDDSNNENIAKACISSIRQILQADGTKLDSSIRENLFDIVVWVFADPMQLYIEQGYNILNLLLYKLNEPVQQKYYVFYKVIVYAILGLPNKYIQNLRFKGDGFSLKFADILQNICIEPDNDLIQNSIGCLRNFIAKSNKDTLHLHKDDFNFSLIEYLFKIVKFVHQNQSQKSSQTDRLIILTIYITLLEYQVVNQNQLGQIITNVVQWMQMQQQVVDQYQQQNMNNQIGNFGRDVIVSKYTYTSVYLQIILLAFYYYGKTAYSMLNVNVIVGRVILLIDNFKCDYQIQRVIVGISNILSNQLLSDTNLVTPLMNSLPELVRKICQLRQEGDRPQNDVEMDDQAIQDQEGKFFGDDENTHMMGWQPPKLNPTANDMLLKGGEQESDQDNDWQEEFNKFYESPLDKFDEVRYLSQVLKDVGGTYAGFMDVKKQEQLSLYLSNAPPKNVFN